MNTKDVIDHLSATGQPLMAIIVANLQASLDESRAANAEWKKTVERLREKYEPQPPRSPTYRDRWD